MGKLNLNVAFSNHLAVRKGAQKSAKKYARTNPSPGKTFNDCCCAFAEVEALLRFASKQSRPRDLAAGVDAGL
jgi:hypothetical protein